MAPEDFPPPEEGDRPFEQALAEVERSLADLKERHTQLISQQQPQEDIQGELAPIREKLEELKLYLKFMVFNWREAREPFWQAVRFGGLGILIGWLLKSHAG